MKSKVKLSFTNKRQGEYFLSYFMHIAWLISLWIPSSLEVNTAQIELELITVFLPLPPEC